MSGLASTRALSRLNSTIPGLKERALRAPYVVPGFAPAINQVDAKLARRGVAVSLAALPDLLPCSELEHHQGCPLCGAEWVQLRYRPRRLGPNREELWADSVGQCPDCELFYRILAIKVHRVPDLHAHDDYSEFLGGDYGKGRRRRYRATLDSLSPMFDQGEGRTLLDFGCGTGLFMRLAQKRGFEPYGVDFSPESVAVARKHFGADRVACGTPGDLAAGRKGFDVITMWSVLAHIADPHEQLSNLRNLLKPGGRLLIYTVNANSLQLKAFWGHWMGFTRNHLIFWSE